ncbi:MAG TPA: hypothetical protein ENK95_03445, partial [Campylobacterales bacterium]|nr:hypothetical protein [Campylobacterales bacterium]
MLTIKNIFFIFIMGTLLTACGSDRAAGEHNSSKGVLGVVESDSDGDGISDADEVNIYGTNPDSNDTDNDGLLDGLEINTYDTNATNPDTDGDCLLDSFEVLNYETNATNVDSDGDGVNDGIEIYTYTEELNSSCLTTPETLLGGANSNPAKDNIPDDGTDVINALDPSNHSDSDGDGLLDSEELFYGTNPDSNDSDNDGLLDSDEINSYDTNATNADTDNDGLLDGLEINTYETNATNSDTDGDCLLDSFEILNYETNATNVDSDGDGVNDGIEIYTYTKELNNSCLTTPETLVGGVNSTPAKDNIPNDGTDVINALDPTNHTDSDGDGLLDSEELFYGTNPDSNDTDNDGLLDIDEINSYDTNATNADTDNDGLLDGLEINTYETNATNSDTDGDCLLDSFEVLNYETNASNADTDSDGVEDGLEIYGDLNASCIDTPESLLDEPNSSPANDNLPAGSTLIDALDPTNDSDGDYQANIKELECAEGNPKDKTKVCLMIDETEEG